MYLREDLLLDNWCDGKLEVPPVKFHSHGSRADQKVSRRPMNSVKAKRTQANLDSSRGSCKNARQLIRAYSIPSHCTLPVCFASLLKADIKGHLLFIAPLLLLKMVCKEIESHYHITLGE